MLYERSRKCPLYHISLGIGSSVDGVAHQNIVFVYRSDNNISLAQYEPHGSDSSSEFIKISHKILSHLTYIISGKYGIKAVYMPPIEVSCPKELQAVSNDQVGYCIAFSYFWLWMVYGTIKHFEAHPDIAEAISKHFQEQDNVTLILRYVEKEYSRLRDYQE